MASARQGDEKTSQQQQNFPNEGGFEESSSSRMMNGLPDSDLVSASTVQQETTRLEMEPPESSKALSWKKRARANSRGPHDVAEHQQSNKALSWKERARANSRGPLDVAEPPESSKALSWKKRARENSRGPHDVAEHQQSKKALSWKERARANSRGPLDVAESQQQAKEGSSRGKMPVRGDSNTIKEVFFQLFSRNTNEYILEQHEVHTGKVEGHRCLLSEINGKWKLKTSRAQTLHGHGDLPLTEEMLPQKFQKIYDSNFQDRLRSWTITEKLRSKGTQKDKYYSNIETHVRSLNEVAAYIIYSTTREQLIPLGAERPNEEGAPAGLLIEDAAPHVHEEEVLGDPLAVEDGIFANLPDIEKLGF